MVEFIMCYSFVDILHVLKISCEYWYAVGIQIFFAITKIEHNSWREEKMEMIWSTYASA